MNRLVIWAAFSLTTVALALTLATSSVTRLSFSSSVLVAAHGAPQLGQDRHRLVADVADGQPDLLQHPAQLQQRDGRQRHQRDEGDGGDQAGDCSYGHGPSLYVGCPRTRGCGPDDPIAGARGRPGSTDRDRRACCKARRRAARPLDSTVPERTPASRAQQLVDPAQPVGQRRLGAVVGRPVVLRVGQLVGQVLLGGDAVRLVVGVPVALAVPVRLRARRSARPAGAPAPARSGRPRRRPWPRRSP